MYDIVTVGNALIDAFLIPQSSSKFAQYDEQTHELRIRLGEKIILEDCQFLLGGNACNVAVGVRRAGLNAALVAEIGDDEFGLKISHGLQSEGVDTKHILKKGQSSFAVGIQMHNDRTLFVEHRDREHDFLFEDIKTDWLYLTSVGNSWKHAYEKTLQYVIDNQVKLAFSPGTLQLTESSEYFQPILEKTYILFLNKDETKRLLHTEENSISKLLQLLQSQGPKNVVITDGKDGAHGIDEKGNIFFVASKPVSVVEKTGAGDSFASGVLAAMINNENLANALLFGTVNAGSVIGRIGSQAGLLSYREMKVAVENLEVIAE